MRPLKKGFLNVFPRCPTFYLIFLGFLTFFHGLSSISLGKNKTIQALIKFYVFLTEKIGCIWTVFLETLPFEKSNEKPMENHLKSQEKHWCLIFFFFTRFLATCLTYFWTEFRPGFGGGKNHEYSVQCYPA